MLDARRHHLGFLLLVGILGTNPALLLAAPRTDLYGDPLPPGVVARLGTIRFRGAFEALAFSPDGKTVFSTDRREVRAWDTATGKQVRRTPLEFAAEARPFLLTHFVLTRDGRTMAGLDVRGGRAHVWDAVTGKERCRVAIPKGTPYAVAIADDGGMLATFFRMPGQEFLIHLHDARTGAELRQLRGHDTYIIALTFSPDGQTLASVDMGGMARLWSTKTGEALYKMRVMNPVPNLRVQSPNFLAFSPDGKLLATNDYARKVQLWDVRSGKELATLEALREGSAAAQVFSPDGKTLAVLGTESIALWDVATRQLRRQWRESSIPLCPLRFSPDGKRLASVQYGGVRLWETATGKSLSIGPKPAGFPSWLAVLPDGKTLVSTFPPESAIYFWDMSTGRLLETRRMEEGRLCGNSLSGDGKYLASSFFEGRLHVWQIPERKEVRRLVLGSIVKGPALAQIPICHLSTDGTRLAVINFPNRRQPAPLYVWDMGTGKRIVNRTLPTAVWPLRSTPFSPDGRIVAIPREDGLSLQDVYTGEVRLQLTGEMSHPLAFSPDAQVLAAAIYAPRPEGRPAYLRQSSDIEQIGLWELATGQEMGRIKTGPIWRLAFAPGGRLLATGGADTLTLWDIATGRPALRRPLQKVHQGVQVSAVMSLAFSPDGRLLTTGTVEGPILVWDIAAARPPKAVHPLEAKELERAWTELAGAASAARAALAALTASPDQTLALFRERLRPAADAPAERLQRLVTDLDNSDFRTRDDAARELRKFGDLAEPALRRALDGKPSLEVRRRIEAVQSANRLLHQPEALRRLRAMRVLEQIATPEARQVLSKLAEGSAAARETAAARAALGRMKH